MTRRDRTQTDAEALSVLYVRYRDRVQTHIEGIVRDPHLAEDITQQVFAKLPEAMRSYEERDVSFSAWIMRVARNAALDELRARRRAQVEPLDPEHGREVALDRTVRLQEALAGLPDEQRRIVLMRDLLGLSASEVARRLGKTEGSVHAMHHRGRLHLRRALRNLGLAPVTVS